MLKFVKVWTDESLYGSIRKDMSPEQRSIWYELLLLAGKSRREGYIEFSKGLPYSNEDIASRLEVDVELINSSVAICLSEGRLEIKENTYHITNWEKYQVTKEKREKNYEDKRHKKEEIAEQIRNHSELDFIASCRQSPEEAIAIANAELERRAKKEQKQKEVDDTNHGLEKLKERAI